MRSETAASLETEATKAVLQSAILQCIQARVEDPLLELHVDPCFVCASQHTGPMDGLHIPPWDSTGSSFQEYPSAAAITAAQSLKRPSKSEKALRLEHEKLQTMVNSIVRLSVPSNIAAGNYSGPKAALTSQAPCTHCMPSKKITERA